MLHGLLEENIIPPRQLLNHLELFQRSSIMARQLHLFELYQLFFDIPGEVLIASNGYGSTLVNLLNLRAILGSNNYIRRILGIEVSMGINSDYHHQNKGYFIVHKFGSIIQSV